MKLQLDLSKTYGIALEGGGARGAYEIGVWQAMEEIGIKYNMVSGTSVGALNGCLMTMRDLEHGKEIWSNLKLSQVLNLEGMDEKTVLDALNGQIDWAQLNGNTPKLLEIIKNRGLDITPLRQWVNELVDIEKIRSSDVSFYVSTVDVTDRKGLEVDVKALPDDRVGDMLLASAYHPTFKKQKLGGKYYADGGFIDTLPIHVLVEHGCHDIIAVRLPSAGIERIFKIPEDVHVTTIATRSDLGPVLAFDGERSKINMKIGYYDAMRVFYGLCGRKYYIDRTMTDREAMDFLLDRYLKKNPDANLREVLERIFPLKALRLNAGKGDYHELMIAVLELLAEKREINPYQILTDHELIDMVTSI